jgi:hypothetical protein
MVEPQRYRMLTRIDNSHRHDPRAIFSQVRDPLVSLKDELVVHKDCQQAVGAAGERVLETERIE